MMVSPFIGRYIAQEGRMILTVGTKEMRSGGGVAAGQEDHTNDGGVGVCAAVNVVQVIVELHQTPPQNDTLKIEQAIRVGSVFVDSSLMLC